MNGNAAEVMNAGHRGFPKVVRHASVVMNSRRRQVGGFLDTGATSRTMAAIAPGWVSAYLRNAEWNDEPYRFARNHTESEEISSSAASVVNPWRWKSSSAAP